MNLVRLHYSDGSVESFSIQGRPLPRIARLRLDSGLNHQAVIASTDERGVLTWTARPSIRREPRWNMAALMAQTFARNMAAARAAEGEALVGYRPASLEAEHDAQVEAEISAKPPLSWYLAAGLLVAAIAAAMVGQAVGAVG